MARQVYWNIKILITFSDMFDEELSKFGIGEERFHGFIAMPTSMVAVGLLVSCPWYALSWCSSSSDTACSTHIMQMVSTLPVYSP